MPMDDKIARERMTRRQRLHHSYLHEKLTDLHYAVHHPRNGRCYALPIEWEEIARRHTQPRRKKVTLLLEEDVLKFYRAFGRGYQQTVNDVLAGFMHAKASEMLRDQAAFEKYVNDFEPVLYPRGHAVEQELRIEALAAKRREEEGDGAAG